MPDDRAPWPPTGKIRLSLPDDYFAQSISRQLAAQEGMARLLKQFADATLPTARALKQIQSSEAMENIGRTLQETASLVSRATEGVDLSGVRSGLAAASRFVNEHPELSGGALAKANFESATFLSAMEGRQAWSTDLQRTLARLAPLFETSIRLSVPDVRLQALALGYEQKLGGSADAFGRLESAVRSKPPLAGAVDELVAAVRTPGALGFDRRRVGAVLGRIDDVLADPEVERSVVEPTEEVLDLTGTGETVIHLPDVLGSARSFRVSTAGVFCGFTIALFHFVMNVANGTPPQVEIVDAVVDGAGFYGLVHGLTTSRSTE